MVGQVVKKYGSIDVVVYNSGAIWWSSVEKTDMKRFQLMQVSLPMLVCTEVVHITARLIFLVLISAC